MQIYFPINNNFYSDDKSIIIDLKNIHTYKKEQILRLLSEMRSIFAIYVTSYISLSIMKQVQFFKIQNEFKVFGDITFLSWWENEAGVWFLIFQAGNQRIKKLWKQQLMI